MKHLGIDVNVRHLPSLDPAFIPLGRFYEAFLKDAEEPFDVAVERSNGQVAVYRTRIHGTEELREADVYYIDRIVKTLLWVKGGFRVYLSGSEAVCDAIKAHYAAGGSRDFDFGYMSDVFEHPFEVVRVDRVPEEKSFSKPVGRHLDGCRIGFDAGGSDRKVSAVIDGESVYSEEVVWFPKVNSDPDYHYNGIVAALKSAAEHLPRVDAVGVSSAGVYINNRTMNASLFLQVPKDQFDAKVKDIYIRAITDTFGNVPYAVANDGDVSALAGTMSLNDTNVLGIAMGTSEAVGYVDKDKNVLGWISELAFAPVDLSENAMRDEWSTDIGAGCKYFSQDAVIKLAPRAGIRLDESRSPADQLKQVQALMEEGDERAAGIFRDIGIYLAHTVVLYARFYDIEKLILMGRVMSGKGGDVILSTAQRVLAADHPALAEKVTLMLPDEKTRRIGQAVAAASLPEIRK